MKIEVESNFVREGEGCVKVMSEPDADDPIIEFYHAGKLVAKAKRNGHHLTYRPPTNRLQSYLWCRMGRHSIKATLCLALYKVFGFILWKKWKPHVKPYNLYYFACKPVEK